MLQMMFLPAEYLGHVITQYWWQANQYKQEQGNLNKIEKFHFLKIHSETRLDFLKSLINNWQYFHFLYLWQRGKILKLFRPDQYDQKVNKYKESYNSTKYVHDFNL